MILIDQWKELLSSQTDESIPKFWEEYSAAEKKIYGEILSDPTVKLTGTFAALRDRFDVSDVLLMGFLDGVSGSLNNAPKLESITDESPIELDIDYDKLYFNMLAANAEHLYKLPQWRSVLTEDKIGEITKDFKRSKTVVKGDQIGRNDPCPCGSGKKYKKCCGA